MKEFAWGMVCFASLVAGSFFIRFWRDTRDPFFLFFSVSLLLLGLERILMVTWRIPSEEYGGLYLVRLLAYLILIGAIVWKNRKRSL